MHSESDTSDLQRAWQEYERRSEALTLFFDRYKCPQENYQLIPAYLESAERHNLDWRLLPAISLQESSCLKRYPRATHNGWGWASARTGFASLQAGIDFVSERLANGRYYAGKDLEGKLRAYNPNPQYTLTIKLLLEQIDPQQ